MPMSKTGYDISSSNKKSQLALSYLLQDVGPSNADASHGSARLKPSTAVIARRTLAYALGFAVLSEASGHGR